MESLFTSILTSKTKDEQEESVEVQAQRKSVSPIIIEGGSPIITYEQPEGWKDGAPMPWSQRYVHYDKPLPVPTRTPSPFLPSSPSPGLERNKSPHPDGSSVAWKVQSSPSPAQADPSTFWQAQTSTAAVVPAITTSAAVITGSTADDEGVATPSDVDSLNQKVDNLEDIALSSPVPSSSENEESNVNLENAENSNIKNQKTTTEINVESSAVNAESTASIARGQTRAESPSIVDKVASWFSAFKASAKSPPNQQKAESYSAGSDNQHQSSFKKGNKENWQSDAVYVPDQFFAPHIFRTDNHQYKRGNKDDWAVIRKYPVDHFFNPALFEEFAYAEPSPKIFVERTYRKGSKDDWQVQRIYNVDQFFEPSLFNELCSAGKPASSSDSESAINSSSSIISESSIMPSSSSIKQSSGPISEVELEHKCRKANKDDWQVTRKYAVDHFFTPWLFDEEYPSEPAPLQTHIPIFCRKGNKDDWQVSREHAVDHFFVPNMFIESDDPLNAIFCAAFEQSAALLAKELVGTTTVATSMAEPSGLAETIINAPAISEASEISAIAESGVVCKRGRKDDWQAVRNSPVDQFFTPGLFIDPADPLNSTFLSAEPLTQAAFEFTIPEGIAEAVLIKAQVDSDQVIAVAVGTGRYRKGNKDDWQAIRKHYVHHYFVPRLFYQRWQHVFTPSEGLKKDWRTERQHTVDHFFNPHMFDLPLRPLLSMGDWLRTDWKVERVYAPEQFFVPSLFDEPILAPSPQMVQAAAEENPAPKFDSADLGARYRDDWKVEREFPVDHFFMPSLFDEEQYLLAPTDEQATMLHKRARDALATPVGSDLSEKRQKSMTRSELASQLFDNIFHQVLSSPRQSNESAVEVKDTSAEEVDSEDVSSVDESTFNSSTWWDANRTETEAIMAWQYALSTGIDQLDRNFLRGHLLSNEGIPADLRATAWIALAGAPMMQALAQLYPQLLDLDLPRDLEIRIESDCEASPQQESVMRVYCVYDPVVTYSTHLRDLASVLLEYLREEYAFGLLVRLNFAYGLRTMHVTDVEGTRAQVWIHDRLMEEKLPDITNHLSMLGVSGINYASAFLMALSQPHHENIELSAAVIDWLLLDGMPAVHSALLGVMASHQEHILELDEGDAIIEYLRKHLLETTISLWDCASDFSFSSEEYATLQLEANDAIHRSNLVASSEEIRAVQADNSDIQEQLNSFYQMMLVALADREQLIRLFEDKRLALLNQQHLAVQQSARIHNLESTTVDQSQLIEGMQAVIKEKEELIQRLQEHQGVLAQPQEHRFDGPGK